MTYLLDTNACIGLINNRPQVIRSRFRAEATAGATIMVPSIVTFELWYGVEKSIRRAANSERLRAFLSGPVEVVVFTDEDAATAGRVRSLLEAAGTPIGAYDVLIAGQALRLGATLVTANASEFGRVAGLQWEDWARL
ncbi:MAG TPA: type II toxin-antitoxin system VapC family toxin [Candidatus Dormibacteraeota bacterium]|nr:type II toxin-antitoxin system VapC family toxin [Candidatus Dormibacteraeota bacterium]